MSKTTHWNTLDRSEGVREIFLRRKGENYINSMEKWMIKAFSVCTSFYPYKGFWGRWWNYLWNKIMAIFTHCKLYYYSVLFTIAVYFMFQVLLFIKVAVLLLLQFILFIIQVFIYYSFLLLLLIIYHCKIFYLLFQVFCTNVNLYYCSLSFLFILYPLKLICLMFFYTIAYYYYYY